MAYYLRSELRRVVDDSATGWSQRVTSSTVAATNIQFARNRAAIRKQYGRPPKALLTDRQTAERYTFLDV